MIVIVAALAALLTILQAATVAAFLMRATRVDEAFARERNDWGVERRELLTRIQAPEIAVAQALQPTQPGGLLYVPMDDDEAFRTNLEEQLSGD